MSPAKPSLQVAVIMALKPVVGPNAKWASHQWHLVDVVANDSTWGDLPRLMGDDASAQTWLHPGRSVTLYKDTAEGYYLNLSSPTPCFWVMWRMEDEPGPRADASQIGKCIAYPEEVTLSYHDAGRWLDAQERVDQVPAPKLVIEWLAEFTAPHHVLDEKRRQRPQSFLSLQDRFGNPARVSTGEKRKGQPG